MHNRVSLHNLAAFPERMDLVNDPIPELIRRIAVPASVGFFFSTMYNVVDTFFAGMISTDALAALSLSFPIFFMLIAVGTGISQGATALMANALGAKNELKAKHYFTQSISFGILLSLLLTALGIVAAPTLFRSLGATGSYLTISLAYMDVILLGTVFILLQSILNAALNALGDTRTYRNVLIVGFGLNLILDPWFLFGGFGIPAMGIKGIALATVLIQIVGCAYLWRRVSKTRLLNGWQRTDLIPRSTTFGEIASQGFPASLNMMTVAIGIYVITWFISQFSQPGVAAYGIATRIEQVFLLPTIGLNIAVLTLTGQNNGADRLDRVKATWHATLKYGLIMMATGGLIIFPLAGFWMSLFTDDASVIRIGAEYLRIASITLCSYVILFQTVFMLQGLKRPMYAIWIGLYRQVLAPCGAFYVLAFYLDWQLKGIWWGIFLVTWSAAIITWIFGNWMLKRVTNR